MTYGYILWETVKMLLLVGLGIGSAAVMAAPWLSLTPVAWWWAPIGAIGLVLAVSLVMYAMWGEE